MLQQATEGKTKEQQQWRQTVENWQKIVNMLNH
jgi:hypothetical protein